MTENTGKNLKDSVKEQAKPQAVNQQLEALTQKLRASEQQLKAMNQRFDASNQQLWATEQQLRASNQQLDANNQQLQPKGEQLLKLNHDLGERVKELNCLYGISHLVEKSDVSLEEIFKGTVDLIPSSWQYPEITCARITMQGQEFKTHNFKETIWKQTSDITIRNEKVGTLEVCYLQEKPESDEGPFLTGERKLIDAVTERLGRITDRKKAEEKLKKQDRLKTELVVNVSHELRTPLTIFKNIISNLQAGVAGSLNPKQHKNLEIADKEIDRLARIISDFLDISKIESGTISLRMQQVRVQSLVSDVAELLKPLADEKNMELVTSMGDEELFVDVDRDRIVQVLANLINNAVKFVPDCGGRVMVRAKKLDNEVSIAVQDNGRGIEPDDMDKIFNRFFQVEKYVGPGEHGTGLGLAISKELTELHGGRIEVASEVGCGTTFTVFLPLMREGGAV